MQTRMFTVSADMGCVRVTSRDFDHFIPNGVGDGTFRLIICLKTSTVFERKRPALTYTGIFYVRTIADITYHDCERESIFKLKRGRYQTWHASDGTVYITYIDADIN